MNLYRYSHCPHCGVALDNTKVVGLSNGSSIYAWRCLECKHEWPRHNFIRGVYPALNDLTAKSDSPTAAAPDERDTP